MNELAKQLVEKQLSIKDGVLVGVAREFTVDIQVQDELTGVSMEKDTTPHDIYILVYYDDCEEQCSIVGWCTGQELMKQAPRPQGEVFNHWLTPEKVHDVKSLPPRKGFEEPNILLTPIEGGKSGEATDGV